MKLIYDVFIKSLFLGCFGLLFVMGCMGGTKPVIKIGLIAPFEGELRHHGYQRLYGVKLALQETNRSGGVAGYKVELVALNDYAEIAETQAQSQEMVIDPAVMAIIGNWDQKLYEATHAIYADAHLIDLKPNAFNHFAALPATFAEDFQTLSGSLPSDEARQGYLTTQKVLHLIEQAVSQFGRLERAYLWQVGQAHNDQ